MMTFPKAPASRQSFVVQSRTSQISKTDERIRFLFHLHLISTKFSLHLTPKAQNAINDKFELDLCLFCTPVH